MSFFSSCSYFYSSISHPARQRVVELQTYPAAMPNSMVLINAGGESQFLIATLMIKAPGEAIIPGVQNSPTTLVTGGFLKLIHCGKLLPLFVAALRGFDRQMPSPALPYCF